MSNECCKIPTEPDNDFADTLRQLRINIELFSELESAIHYLYLK